MNRNRCILGAAFAVAVLAVQTAPAQEEAPAGFSLRYVPETRTAASAGEFVPSFQAEDDNSGGELSAGKAVLYSLLLPGLGDWYAGNKTRATSFFIVDAAIWTSFIVFQIQGHDREDAYQNMAVGLAGVSSTGHSDDFYSVIGQYNTSDVYESEFKKEARIDIWPDVGYEAMEAYYLANRVADFEEWAWQSSDQRIDYRQLRSASKLSIRRSKYVLALAAANRLVASIFAYQGVRSANRGREEIGASPADRGGYRLEISSPPGARRDRYTAAVSIVRSF